MGPSSGVSWEQLPWFRLLGVSAWLLWGAGKEGGRQTRACCGPGGAHRRSATTVLGVGRGQRALWGARDTEA